MIYGMRSKNNTCSEETNHFDLLTSNSQRRVRHYIS